MKQLLLKQLTTKRLILLVLSFIMLMPSTAWGDAPFYAVLSADGKTVTFYCDDQKTSRGGEDIFATTERFYAEATTAVIDKSMANYAPADMTAWFVNCSALTSITGLENLNTSEVRNMQSLFQGCSSLTSLDLTGFDTSNLINMNGMFAECSSLKSVDLSSFNTSKVTDMGGLFAYCSGLETIYVDETRWSTAAVTSENNGNSGLFYECGPLVGGNGTAYYDTYEEDLAYARVDKPGQPGYLTHKDGPVIAGKEPYAVLSENNTVLTFYYDNQKAERNGMDVGPFSKNSSWYEQRQSITSVVFDDSFANCTTLTSTAYWFDGLKNLSSISGIGNLKTDNVTNMGGMFRYCSSLTSLDVTGFKTDKVTDMGGMFLDCSGLTSLDVTGFKTDNAIFLGGMFYGCSGLTSLDVTGFKTDILMDMYWMFHGCSGLTSLDLSSFNTARVTDMNRVFDYCSSLTTIYVGDGWSTKSVRGGEHMFEGCTSLKGGAGTVYDTNHTDYTYARIDGGTGNPGYLTKKGSPATESCDMSEIPTDNAYYAATSFLCERGVLDGSKVGGKYLVEDPLLRKHLANVSFRGLFTLKGREIPSTFVSDQYPDVYDDLKSDSSYYQAAKVLLYLDYGDGITPFDRDRDGFFPDGNEARINILKELMEAFNIKPDTVGTDNPFPKDADIKSLSESSPIKMGYVRQAAKLGIITTENEQFRPYDDCLRGEAFLMLTRIIQKIEAGEITDPNPKESDFLDPNSGTGTAEPYAVLSDDNTVLTFYYDNKKESRGGIDINNTYIMPGSSSPYGTATTAILDASFANYKPTSTAYWFQRCSSLTSITGMENLKTGNVTSMEDMFSHCSSLTSLDLSNFNTVSVTNMSELFYGCSGLTSLDVSSFNTANVTNMLYMFRNCSHLSSLDVSGFNTSNVTDMSFMFYGCSGLTSLDLSNFNTANVTLMGSMFSGCSGLITIYVGSGWTTTSLTTGGWMFEGCVNLVGGAGTVVVEANNYKYTGESYAHIDGGTDNPGYFTDKSATPVDDGSEPYAVLSEDNNVVTFYYDDQKEARGGMDINNSYNSGSPYGSATTVVIDASFADYRPTSTAYWFKSCSLLTSITGMKYLKTDNVTDMGYMFYNCTGLTSLDLSGFNTQNVTDMGYMFYNCSRLTNLDVTGFNTQNVTTMDNMFCGCSGLTSLNVKDFNTQNVTNMNYMFGSCSGLTSLDVTGFNTQNVTNMYGVFWLCSSLTTIYVGNEWSTAAVKFSTDMFFDCTNLKGGEGTTYDSSHVDYTYAHIDGGTDNPGYFTEKSATPVEGDAEPYAVLSDDNTILTFYYDDKKESRGGIEINSKFISYGHNSAYGSATKAVFDASFANYMPVSTAYWFNNCSSLTSIVGIENLNTANVTKMNDMFIRCSSLTSLDVSGFKTDNVTDMGEMFADCSGLTSLDVSGFKTDKVTDIHMMFSGCSGLASLDVSGFKTDNVTRMSELFSGCSGLTSLDVSGFKTDNVTTMGSMFSGCSGLTSLDVSGFNTANVWNMSEMFSGCSDLASLDVSGFKTDNVTRMGSMFSGCSGLTSLDVSGFKTDNVTTMGSMFSGCSGLTSLDVSGFKTDNVTDMRSMFADCSGLTSLDVSGFKTGNVTDMVAMFSGCSGLTSLDLSSFKTDNVTNMLGMFKGCSALKTIYAGNDWSTTAVTRNSSEMFSGCTSLVGGNGTVFSSSHTNDAYARIDAGTSAPGYFTEKSATPVEDGSEPYAVLSNSNTVLTFYYDSKKESRGGLSVGPFKDEKDRAWNTYRESISSVVFDESFANCTTLTSTAYWFYECSSLTGITGISNLKTDHVTDMKFMFHGCESLTSIDVSGFKTDNVENIQGMFFRCEQLTSMDLSGFNTEKVTNMSALFSRCEGMTSVDLSGFKTDLVTSMRLMFNQCSSLTSLNLSDFNTEKVTDMGYMFADCSRLKTIYISKTGWDFSQLLDGTNMFKNCTNLKGGAGTAYDGNHTDYAYAHIDGGAANPGYFTEKNATPVEDGLEPYAVFDSGTLTFYYDDKKESRGGMSVGPFALDDERWDGYSENITTVVFDPSFAKCTSLTSTAYWFFECYNLTTIKGIENLKTGNVTDMSAMFYQCSSLTSLDLANWDTRNVTNMMCMFMYCSELTSLNLMGFNTAKVTDMDCMFRSCRKLGSLLLNDFDTGNVTNMRFMFLDCPNLIALDVSSFNTSKVTNMSSMFKSCSKLTALDVTCFNTSSVTDMGYMFSDCPSLKTIDVSSFDTKNVTDFRCMFYGCSELSTIYCNDTWNSEAESSQMFDGCEKLVGGNGTTYDADHKDGTYARVDGGADAPGYFTTNGVVDENIEYKYGEGTGLVVHAAKDDTMELYIKGTVIIDDVACPVTAIGESAFENNTVLEEVSIPATITSFGEKAFAGCINLKAIYVYIRIPVDITSSKARTRGDGVSTVFEGVDTETCTLYVPAGSGDSYRNAEGWKDFKNIVEMGESCEITIGKNGKTTFCGNTGLDFNGTDEVKAFIATGFDKDESIIWMTRIMDVPAGVPVMIKGDANTTYNIPVTDGGTSYYKNMFVGNTSGDTLVISKTSEDGQYVNYYMSGGQFKSVSGSAKIGPNKCYLQLPANLGAESTGEPLQVKIAASGKSSFAAPYDLDFTSLNDDVKAFTATGYDKSSKTIWLTRVKKVQKGEGLLLKGTGGETYTIPSSGVQAAYVNMIVGNISGENLEIGETSKNGSLTNYYLKGGTYVSVSGTANIGTNKSYLQLPTYMLAGARSEDAVNVSDVQTTYNVVELETESMPIIFASIGHDDNGTTGIQSMFNDQSSMFNDQWYTLSGQRISKPTKSGLYIHQGKKVVIK